MNELLGGIARCEVATLKSYWDGPRWSGFESFLRDLCHMLGCKCEIEVEKSFLTEHGRFTVSGTDEQIMAFKRKYAAAVAAYNTDA